MSLKKEKHEETDDMTKLTTKREISKDLLRLENENAVISSLNLKENTKHKIVRPSVSSVLDQVKNFLPQMKEAEEILRKKMATSPDDVNIENVDNDDRVIEMNLSLFEYSGESESSSSESDSESSDEENVGKNKLVQET